MSLLISFQHMMTPTRSVGQANFFSKTSQTIDLKGTPIVRVLASRCITRNGLRIQTHQHIGFKLHLDWHVTDNNNHKSLRYLERGFSEYGSLLDFCTQLKNGVFEGLCYCVCTHFIEWKEEKLNPVFWNIPHNHKLDNSAFYDPRNVQNRYKTEETTLNVCAQCTDSASLYGMILIRLILHGILP